MTHLTDLLLCDRQYHRAVTTKIYFNVSQVWLFKKITWLSAKKKFLYNFKILVKEIPKKITDIKFWQFKISEKFINSYI